MAAFRFRSISLSEIFVSFMQQRYQSQSHLFPAPKPVYPRFRLMNRPGQATIWLDVTDPISLWGSEVKYSKVYEQFTAFLYNRQNKCNGLYNDKNINHKYKNNLKLKLYLIIKFEFFYINS